MNLNAKMEIKIIKSPIKMDELKKMAIEGFGSLVKAVVDVEQGIMALGGELHADEEVLLMEQEGSSRAYTWGVNIYPEKTGDDRIEFDSMVNLKPTLRNLSRNVENEEVRKKIIKVVNELILR
ncbi:MAG: DUF5674 family protein [bacterium]|nr:DUF5674 family protein [bacterium]